MIRKSVNQINEKEVSHIAEVLHKKSEDRNIYIAFCQLSTEWRTVSATSYNMALSYVQHTLGMI